MIDRIDTPSCFEAKLEKEGEIADLLWFERNPGNSTVARPKKPRQCISVETTKRPESPTPLVSVDLKD